MSKILSNIGADEQVMTKEQIEAIKQLKSMVDEGQDVSVSFKRDLIDVTPIEEIDLSWSYVDKAGHKHRYKKSRNGRISITGIRLELGYWPDGDTYHYPVCRFCEEPIAGGTTPVIHTKYVPGLMRCYINGEEVTEETARSIAEYIRKKKR